MNDDEIPISYIHKANFFGDAYHFQFPPPALLLYFYKIQGTKIMNGYFPKKHLVECLGYKT